jgi:hypothetical protein
MALNPCAAWSQLALGTAQMLAASASVIAHRTSRPASAVDLYGMGSEKMEAGLRSSHAMMRELAAMRPTTPAELWSAYARVLSRGLAPVRARALSNAKRYSRPRT